MTHVTLERWVGLSVFEKFIKCETDVFGNLTEQDWRDVSALMERSRCTAVCGIAKLLM